MCVRNVEHYIEDCITAISNQTFRDFELIIIDDRSIDNTKKIIEKSDDKRVRLIRNKKRLGTARSRNRGLKYAKGKYIFFTDGDCTVSKNWIEKGLKPLLESDCIAVEGKTYYVSETYRPTFSDDVIQSKKAGQFMTCNMAYKTRVLKKIGGFDEKYIYNDDRDLALRALKLGRICFNPEMIVYHQKIIVEPMKFVKSGKKIRDRVLLYKKFGEKKSILWRIVYPKNLMMVIFPPLIFVSLFRNRYATKQDLLLFPFIYLRLIWERLNLWAMCTKEKVFFI